MEEETREVAAGKGEDGGDRDAGENRERWAVGRRMREFGNGSSVRSCWADPTCQPG